MENKFNSNLSFQNRGDVYIERENAKKSLEEKIDKWCNAVIYGPEGIGKTTFLNHFFTLERKKEFAKRNILVGDGIFPTPDLMDRKEIFKFFIDLVRKAVSSLCCVNPEMGNTLLKSCMEICESYSESSMRLQIMCSLLYEKGYRILMVIDQFEEFVSSPDVTPEQHNILRSIIANRQKYNVMFVVATNYDFSQTSLPDDVKGSYLLQQLSPDECKIEIHGLSLEECRDLLEQTCPDCQKEDIPTLYELSGGIPILLNKAAYYAADSFKRNGKTDWGFVQDSIDNDDSVKVLFSHWCRLLTQSETELLNLLAKQSIDGEPFSVELYKDGTIPLLLRRGLIVPVELQEDYYRLNSVLFWSRLAHHPLAETPAELSLSEETKKKDDLLSTAVDSLKSLTEALNNISRIGYPTGNIVQNNQYNINISPADSFINRLGLGSSQSSAFLKEIVSQVDNQMTKDRSSVQKIPEEDIDHRISEYADILLPDTNRNELPDDDLNEIDRQFSRIRKKMGLEEKLNDDILYSFPEECRFYVKDALIIEESTKDVVNSLNDGISAYLVLYGKCLERCLRERFYPLFHECEQISSLEGAECFRDKNQEETVIGNYSKFLNPTSGSHQNTENLADVLGESCARYHISLLLGWNAPHDQNRQGWTRWWEDFARHLDEARKLRNQADHAGQVPGSVELTKMKDILFGENGLLCQSQVAVILRQMFLGEEYASNQNMRGQECTLLVKSKKENHEIVGFLQRGENDDRIILGHISKKKSMKLGLEITVGCEISVSVGDYNSGNRWYEVSPIQ